MIRSYLRVAWRHLAKNKVYTATNIVGLAVGMTTALLIGLWIQDETTFDHYSPDHSRIVEVMTRSTVTKPIWGGHASAEHPETYTGRTISTAISPSLKAGVAADVFAITALTSHPNDFLLAAGDNSLTRHGVWAQSTLPGLFGFRLITGTAASLEDPNTLLLDQSTATALFGNTDAVGHAVRINSKQTYQVGGVYADLPANTTFHEDGVILSWNSHDVAWLNGNTDWDDHSALLYARLTNNTTIDQATARIKHLPPGHYDGRTEELLAYPLDRLRLHNDEYDHNNGSTRLHDLKVFAIVGALVLLLACINFMNLSTARSGQRAKEVGIRKTIGSLRSQLIAQFLSESLCIALLAFALAILLSAIALPGFNRLSGKSLIFPRTSLPFWTAGLIFTAIVGLLAGSYPAFYLSSFRPIRVLKNVFRTGRSASLARKVLVVTQFTISLSLIICTIVIFRQISFARERALGYDYDHLVTVYENTDTLRHQSAALRNDLLRTGVVAALAESSQSTTGFDNGNGLEWPGQSDVQKGIMFHNVNVDPDFGKTVRWTLREGRDFSRDYATDSNAMVINEAAVKAAGFQHPLDMNVTFFGKPYHIIGVVGDMLTNSPYEAITPALFIYGHKSDLTIRLAGGTPINTALSKLEVIFKRYNPESPFIYSFNDENYAKKFKEEARQGNITVVLSILAIFISCLGLFALASFIAEQRTKEIGVRKVLGAGVPHLWALLSKDFVLLTLLSMLIAMPLMFLLMTRWLQNYTYRAPLSWWIFAVAGAGILLITLATVSFQSIKAALANPVDSLRTE